MIARDIEAARSAMVNLLELWRSMSRPVNILLVEDDGRDIELTSRALSGFRVSLKVAVNGTEAKRLMDAQAFDLCFLDLRLPDAPGIDVLRWAKERHSYLPVFVLTGMGLESKDVTEALSAGAKCAILKPLSSEDAQLFLGGLR